MSVAGDLLNAAILRKSRTPIVRQTEAAECGLACIAMIAGHHGHRIDLAALRRNYNISLKGMTLHDVVRIASQLQLSTRALRAEISHLNLLRLPCILHWDHSHFVVLTRVGVRSVVIHDPAAGWRKITLAEVSRRFTGVALEAWATEGFERRTERARVRVFDLLRRTKGFAAAALQISSYVAVP